MSAHTYDNVCLTTIRATARDICDVCNVGESAEYLIFRLGLMVLEILLALQIIW